MEGGRPEWTFVEGLRHYPREVAGLLKKKQPFLRGIIYEKVDGKWEKTGKRREDSEQML